MKKTIGTIVLILSYVAGLFLWLFSIYAAYFHGALGWVILGVLLGGVGVVPIAFIISLIAHAWFEATFILVGSLTVYGLRFLFVLLNQKAESTQIKTIKSTDELYKSDDIVSAFGNHLAEQKSIIPDIQRLPYSKQEIHAALVNKEQDLCDIANSYVNEGRKDKIPEIEKIISSLGACRVALQTYIEIDQDDKPAVDYFNSFESIKKIPAQEKNEFDALLSKYMMKGWEKSCENDNPGEEDGFTGNLLLKSPVI